MSGLTRCPCGKHCGNPRQLGNFILLDRHVAKQNAPRDDNKKLNPCKTGQAHTVRSLESHDTPVRQALPSFSSPRKQRSEGVRLRTGLLPVIKKGYIQRYILLNFVCAGGDSNPQADGMRPSNARVYQFRHLRVYFKSLQPSKMTT